MKRIGFIGLGAMAREVTRILAKENGNAPRIVGVLETPEGRAQAAQFVEDGVPVVDTLADLLALDPDIVAEAAGQSAVREHGEAVLRAGKNLLIISVGGLANQELYTRLRAAARETGAQVLLPAGALGGIDALAAARLGGITAVRQRIAKPPSAWKNTPAEDKVDLGSLSHAKVFFEGSAREAATNYPQNANVAAAVAMAGLGFDRSRVSLVADPALDGPHHTVEVEGAFGQFRFELQGRPLPANPKTSALAAFSVARALLNVTAPIAI